MNVSNSNSHLGFNANIGTSITSLIPFFESFSYIIYNLSVYLS